jgi:hypothetical protein
MRVTFQRVGGQFPLATRTASVDTDSLSDEESRQLHELVARAGVSELAGRRPAESAARDQYAYLLTVEHSGQSHRIEVTDSDMPASVRPLVDYMRSRAR